MPRARSRQPTPRLARLRPRKASAFLSPGPAVLYIVARSLAGGFAEGVRAAVGLSLGASGHVALTAVGVAAALTHFHAWNSGLAATAGAP